MRKLDFTLGVVLGVILTIIGAYSQFYLYKEFEIKKDKKELDISTIKQIDNRLNRSSMILYNSESSVFTRRWESYKSEVINPWNRNISIIEDNIKKNHKEIYYVFEQTCTDFRDIHKILNEIRKLQNPEDEEKQKLKNREKEAGKLLEKISDNVLKIKKELLK